MGAPQRGEIQNHPNSMCNEAAIVTLPPIQHRYIYNCTSSSVTITRVYPPVESCSTTPSRPLPYDWTVCSNSLIHQRTDGNTRADPSDPGTVLLTGVECRGVEAAGTECNTGQGFLTNTSDCPVDPETISLQLHVACRQFPVLEALEALTTPGAGAH